MAELPKINTNSMESKLENLIQQNMSGFELVAGITEDVLNVNRQSLANQEEWMQTQREQYLSEMASTEEARREQTRLLGQAILGNEPKSDNTQLEKKPESGGDGGGLISAVAGSMGVAWSAILAKLLSRNCNRRKRKYPACI